MSESPLLGGVLPVFQTPFNDDDSIDRATLEKELGWVFDQGSDGIVFAMVSEVLRLSEEERLSVAELACRVGRDRGVVVISAGAESTYNAIRFAIHAEDHGATAIMAIPPLATDPPEEEIFGYYGALVATTTVPVIVQDASGYVGHPISIATQARLSDEFGDRIMFKPEAPPIGQRLSELREATRGNARVFEGTGGIALVDNHRRGIVGTMPGADLCWALVALWRALEDGQADRADSLHGPLAALVALATNLDAFLDIEKYLLHRQGIFKNTRVRGPVAFHLDADTIREVDRRVDQLREIVG
jgi:dihydrodipicolinate synthase/N-acetylneuraminate lyase